MKARTVVKAKWDDYAIPKREFAFANGRERLRELICYISARCKDDPTFAKTKLYKILYFSDFLYYAYFGKPITGVPYVRLPRGPVPKPIRRMMAEMDGDDITIEKRPFHGYVQHKIVPAREAKIDELFKPRHISMVDSVIQVLWGKTATEVSDMSHTRAWRIAKKNGMIPYQAIFISDEPVNDYDISRARELSRKYGWAIE